MSRRGDTAAVKQGRTAAILAAVLTIGIFGTAAAQQSTFQAPQPLGGGGFQIPQSLDSGGFQTPQPLDGSFGGGFGGFGAGGPGQEQSVVTLYAEDSAVAPGSTAWLAYNVEIIPDWHVYWVNAGDAGQGTEISWTAPDGVSVGPIVWPAPHRVDIDMFTNYGYENSVDYLIPVTISPEWSVGEPIKLVGEAMWQVCGGGLCIPKFETLEIEISTEIELSTAAVAVKDPAQAERFAAVRAALPKVSDYSATVSRDGDGEDAPLNLRIDGLDPTAFDSLYFYPDVPNAIEHAAPQPVAAVDGGAVLTLKPGYEPPAGPAFSGVLETTKDGVSEQVYVGPANGPGAPHMAVLGLAFTPPVGATGAPTLLALLAGAFLGGMILNLMPCVFPVLAIKALALAGKAHAESRERVAQSLAYAVGVLVFFLSLAGVMFALRAAGGAVGWGFQLQNPLVTTGLGAVFLLVAMNLSGVFEITAPGGIGDKAASQGGARGAFFTGALAVLAATPCVAPFMGVAIPAALAGPVWSGLLVFAALGLGMAAPMVALGLWPGLGRALPRPGPWMARLKEFLAFPMYASAGWMFWVLSGQVSRPGFFWALMGASLIGLAAWAYGLAQRSERSPLALATASVAMVGALGMLYWAQADADDIAPAQAGFTRAAVEEARGAGPVFVYLTADWCMTCKVNERVAFGEAYQQAVADHGVTVIKGDWTRPNPEIKAYLDDVGRAGVPVYAVYSAGGEAQILPQIITESMLVAALGAAS